MDEPAIEVQGDVVEIRPQGSFERGYAEQVLAAVAEVRAGHPRVFLLASAAGSITPEARRYISEWLRSTPIPLETVVWGGGAVQRAVAEMVARSVHFFRPGNVHIHFVRTREDALAWIAAQRERPTPY